MGGGKDIYTKIKKDCAKWRWVLCVRCARDGGRGVLVCVGMSAL